MKSVNPDHRGYFGPFGGRFVPETLFEPLLEVEKAWKTARRDPKFRAELAVVLRDFVGRPTPLTFAANLSRELGLKLYLKREDLTHTGAHKINNTVAQALIARRMGKTTLIAETGAGQHGVATAAAAAFFGMRCRVFMGTDDMARQAPNVDRMRLLGAEVVPVAGGTRTLKDATSEALRAWSAVLKDTHYVLGSVLGPHPYPAMVAEFQAVIGREARRQILAQAGRLPDLVVACVGGGSNSIGVFSGFLKDRKVALLGVEGGGEGIAGGRHAARFSGGRPGVLHGCRTYLLQTPDGQVKNTHSAAAGLDYPAIGPAHALLRLQGRAHYSHATDSEALVAFRNLCRAEGIVPALESSHALAWVRRERRKLRGKLILLNLSGRGDKDLAALAARLEFR